VAGRLFTELEVTGVSNVVARGRRGSVARDLREGPGALVARDGLSGGEDAVGSIEAAGSIEMFTKSATAIPGWYDVRYARFGILMPKGCVDVLRVDCSVEGSGEPGAEVAGLSGGVSARSSIPGSDWSE
jgi:hypothetical protein